jgi:hypothetical protein
MTKDDYPLPLRNYIDIDRTGHASFEYAYASGALTCVIKHALDKVRATASRRGLRAQAAGLGELEIYLADAIAEQELARRQWAEVLETLLAARRAASQAAQDAARAETAKP